MSESNPEPFTRTFGHGGIKLTAYPSSGRIGVEVSAVNAVMDWWELEDFVAELKAVKPITSVRDLVGIAPGWTDGMSSVDWVRAQRDRT